MRSMLAGFTTRGRAFVAAGAAAGVLGLGLGQRTLLSIGGVLIILPILSVLAASRTRYRITWARAVTPARVPAGHTSSVSIQLDNVSRLPTGLLLAEDTVPYSIGSRPRFILDRIEPGGSRRLSYPIQPDHRGKFAIGPLHVRVADAFGLAKVGSTAAPPVTLVVTPAVTALPHTSLAGSWLGEGDARASTAASIGVHLAREEMDTEFITDMGKAVAPGSFEDVLLDTLAVIRPSRNASLTSGLA